MNAVAKPEEAQIVEHLAPVSETVQVLQMYERAARDPSIDVTKMREIMSMRKEIVAEQAKERWEAAMVAAQTEMRPIAADLANKQTNSRYASYLTLDRAMRPIYTKHGFSLCFDTEDAGVPELVRMVCDVSCANHTRRFHIDMPADGKGAKGGDVMTRTHATGSASSYGRRYLKLMIFDIVIGDDDDGNAAGASEPINEDQLSEINKLCGETTTDIETFCKVMKVEALAFITKANFPKAVAKLITKRAQISKAQASS